MIMLIRSRLHLIGDLPKELSSVNVLEIARTGTVQQFIPITLCAMQIKVDADKVLWFIQHRDEINAPHPCIVLGTSYSLVFKVSVGLYLFDGNHRANAALLTRQRLTAHYIDLTVNHVSK